MLHGKFETQSFENFDGLATDLGPILISHKNGKDCMIISRVTLRSTQIELTDPTLDVMFKKRNKWHKEFSSPLEQNTRINEYDGNITIEYGFGEAFRDTEAYLAADDFPDEIGKFSTL